MYYFDVDNASLTCIHSQLFLLFIDKKLLNVFVYGKEIIPLVLCAGYQIIVKEKSESKLPDIYQIIIVKEKGKI